MDGLRRDVAVTVVMGPVCGVGVGGGRALVPACPSPRLVAGLARNMRSKGRGPDSLPPHLQHREWESASEGEVKKELGIDVNREKEPLVEAIYRRSTRQ